MLYCGQARDSVLAAGQVAGECLQEFVGALAASYDLPACGPDSTEGALERLSCLIERHRAALGDGRCELLSALLSYWRALNGDLERHVDDAQKVEEPLRWEDGRRVVVLTALVMVEVDRSL